MRRSLVLSLLSLVVLVTVATPAHAADPIVHVVKPGENLYRIGLRYGVTVDALVSANGLSSASRIYVGQRLTIPSESGSGSTSPPSSSGVHVVRPGENLYRIALRYGTTYQALASMNNVVNANSIYVGQRLNVPGSGNSSSPSTPSMPTTGGTTHYTVQRGDTLSAIALRHGVSTWSLAQANGIRNPSFIYVGQVLRIPNGGASGGSSGGSTGPVSGRWIDIDLSEQRLRAYQGSTVVRSTLVSTGLSRYPTPVGQYRVYVKYVADDMAGPGYYLPDVPYTMYFYRGYAIHGTYWHSNFGVPMSHGCINLPTPEARWLFNWSSVGTLVKIHW